MFYREHKRVVKKFTKPSLAKQEFRQDCDVNSIMARYEKTGMIDHVAKYQGRYDDLMSIDFEAAMRTVANAQQAFMELPSEIRRQFGNDPALFLDFAGDPQNEDAMREMGLLPKTAPTEAAEGAGGPSQKAGPPTAGAEEAPQEASEGDTGAKKEPA